VSRSVVVTGCGRGIGRSIAARLLVDGWTVVGIERDAAFVPQLQAAGLAAVVTGDVSVPATHAEAVSRAVAIAPLLGWVNNAGIVGETPLHNVDPQLVERTIAVNLLGSFWGCSAAVRAFVAGGNGGSIVNVSSIHGQRAVRANTAAYDASKAGIDALTRYVGVAYGHRGIRANAIAPAGVRTELFDEYVAVAADPETLERDTAAAHPLGRIAEPREIAAVASFLLSDESSFVTGAVLCADGGAGACAQPFSVD
jgi:NAD(P)-dependent dehydrogenase (short-subunit alcohol dehydrogenase family)